MNTLPQDLVSRPKVEGHLYATCERDVTGKCILSRKDFKTPIHISKPYWDGNSLLLNLMCPTAGMLADDSVNIRIEVSPGAALTVSNPSSLRIHKMESGREATWTQHFTVGANSILENSPEWLILQGESSFTQRTSISVDSGGELFFIEPIAPGRIAHGESFAFRRFRNRLSLHYAEKLALLEKHALEPDQQTTRSWSENTQYPRPFYVSILVVSDKIEDNSEIWDSIYRLQSDSLLIGSSKLAHGPCWNVKLLASEPVTARKAVASVRESFYSHIGRKPAALRR